MNADKRRCHSGMMERLRILALLGPLILMLALACTPGISFTEDLGRHLLLGRIICEQHAVPRTNCLTYTHPDFPFVNHHWLSEVILYLLHRTVGLNGLIVWKMVMLTGALGLAMWTCRPWDRAREAAGGTDAGPSVPAFGRTATVSLYWLAGILAAVMMGFRSHIRPELFTYLFVAVYGWLFERIRNGARWPRWAILPLACLWANAHIYFIFGVGMAAAFALERWLEKRSRNALFWEAAWLGAIVLAGCVNPNGGKGFLYPFSIFTNYGIDITENASPLSYWRSVLNPMLLALPLLSLLGLVGLARGVRMSLRTGSRLPPRLANHLIMLAALAATWKMARSVPLLALTALPVIGAWLQEKREGASHVEVRVSGVGRIVSALSLTWTILVVALNLWLLHGVLEGGYNRVFPSPVGPTPFGFDREERYGRLRALAEQGGLRGPVFSDYNLGSLVEYELYPQKGYVDNRPEAFPAAFWREEYVPALALADGWDLICEKRKINAVIVSLPGVREAYVREMMRRPAWVLVHLDELCAVWVRNTEENNLLISRHSFMKYPGLHAYERQLAERLLALPDVPWWRRQVEADRIVYGLYGLVCIGQEPRVWPYLWQLHRMYPDYQVVHELLRVTAPRDQFARIEPALAARARWPLAAKQVLDWASHLAAAGRADDAYRALIRGRFFFPLSPVLRDAVRLHQRTRTPPTS
jgi:hypothetical protein